MPDELCQVSPKSHYISLALHSDPSPFVKTKLDSKKTLRPSHGEAKGSSSSRTTLKTTGLMITPRPSLIRTSRLIRTSSIIITPSMANRSFHGQQHPLSQISQSSVKSSGLRVEASGPLLAARESEVCTVQPIATRAGP